MGGVALSKEARFSLWSLDPEISLDDIPELLSLEYAREISYLEGINGLVNFDRTLMHRWMPYSEDKGFSIQTYEILGITVSCIPAKALIETAAPRDEAVFGTFVLPRNKRIQQSILEVFFFELAGRVYTIVKGPEYKTRYVRTNLMGASRKADDQHKGWKKVQFNNIANYSFPSEFFYWLISKENQTIKTEIFDLQISDIRFLSQSVDRKDIKHESEGRNLLHEAVPKTGLGINTKVGQVGTTIISEEGTIRFVLYETGESSVDIYESAINSSNGEIEPFDQQLDIGSLMLYAVILPALKAAFNADKGKLWTVQHQADSRKHWALGAINELCAENQITFDEIKKLDWFK
jgi:hypothetical protein